jgi:GT2 family glycosyltransferase
MATYNRRDVTVRCLRSLERAALPDGASISVTIADASSSDGTGAAAAEFDFVEVIPVPSTYYWAQAMRAAWEHSAGFPYDYLIWLNDDVVLDGDAVTRLHTVAGSQGNESVVAGAVRDPQSGQTTYGAFRFGTGLNRLNMPSVYPGEIPVACDAFNGNVVLIPRSVDRRIGGFPSGYVHGLADYAYGLEARRRGVDLTLAPATVGTCSRNAVDGTWVDRSLTASERY